MMPSRSRVLQERAWARARLFAAGEFDYEAAIRPLYRYAYENGIVEDFGIEFVRGIVADAFNGFIEQ